MITPPDFKLYHKAIFIKQKNVIRKQGLRINICMYSQLIFDKGTKHTQWGKDSFFNK